MAGQTEAVAGQTEAVACQTEAVAGQTEAGPGAQTGDRYLARLSRGDDNQRLQAGCPCNIPQLGPLHHGESAVLYFPYKTPRTAPFHPLSVVHLLVYLWRCCAGSCFPLMSAMLL